MGRGRTAQQAARLGRLAMQSRGLTTGKSAGKVWDNAALRTALLPPALTSSTVVHDADVHHVPLQGVPSKADLAAAAHKTEAGRGAAKQVLDCSQRMTIPRQPK